MARLAHHRGCVHSGSVGDPHHETDTLAGGRKRRATPAPHHPSHFAYPSPLDPSGNHRTRRADSGGADRPQRFDPERGPRPRAGVYAQRLWSSVVAGFVTVMENTFQPGDWIELDGSYGEVKSMAGRAVHLVTTDDTEVIIPLSRTWSAKVLNSTS